jgi:diguanylate cyclase (GGDEF)-like protein
MELAPAVPVRSFDQPKITHVIEKRKTPRQSSQVADPWKMYVRERRSRQRLDQRYQNMRSALERSELELAHYKKMAFCDHLTGLYNQGFIDQKVRKALRAASETSLKRYVCMVVADINFLKFFNDTFGHEKGNEMIKLFAKKIKELAGNWEIAARTGFGDEFLLISLKESEQEAMTLGEHARLELSHIPFEAENSTYGISASVGFAYAKLDSSFSFNKTFNEADQAMYLRKRSRTMPAWIPEGVVPR